MIKFSTAPQSERDWSLASLRLRYRLTSTPIPIRDSHDAARLLHSSWDADQLPIQEQVAALYLDARDQALGFRLISTGKLCTSQVDTSLLLACGLLLRAKSLIVAHNHPSGDPTPSKSDLRYTIHLQKAAELVGLELHDHIILVGDGYHSMADARNFMPTRLIRQ